MEYQQLFITLVDQILSAKQHPPVSPFDKGESFVADTSALERQIDKMVRAGHNLPLQVLLSEEIAIVEGKG